MMLSRPALPRLACHSCWCLFLGRQDSTSKLGEPRRAALKIAIPPAFLNVETREASVLDGSPGGAEHGAALGCGRGAQRVKAAGAGLAGPGSGPLC